MRLPHQQRGLGMFNLMYILISLAIFGYIGLKMFPLYLESVKIKRAVEAVAESPGATEKTPKELAYDVVKRLDVDAVMRIQEHNWKDTLKIESRRGKVVISADYRAELPLFLNLAVVAHFQHEAKNR